MGVQVGVTSRPDQPEGKRKFWASIASQSYLILSGSVLLILSASLVVYFSFWETLHHVSQLAESDMPNMIDSVEVARHSTIVVNSAFRLISASSQEDHEAAVATVARERAALDDIILRLESRSDFGARAQRIRSHLSQLVQYLEVITESAARRLAIKQILIPLAKELAEINRGIEHDMAQAIDDQGFFLVEGLRELDGPRYSINERASEDELTTYRNLASVNHRANLAVLLLDETLVLTDPQYLPPIEERFQSALRDAQVAFSKLPASHQSASLAVNLQRLEEIGMASEGIIVLRREALLRRNQEQSALMHARAGSELLAAEVNALGAQINSKAISSSEASRAAVSNGLLSLIVLNVLSVIGAILFGWLYVWRSLVRRLINLAGAMRMMASGDLEVPITVGGNDEVTDMAEALEVFRRYALEVQRLNLVEKLAEELDVKNESLEHALENLKQAQQQIIAEEKLSSLGQLTAGVAHEIKNPLNFISNFSAIAIEFTEEIDELVVEAGESDTVKEIQSILEELRQSLKKILEHGQRADGVVRSMLEHSRSNAGEWRETDLNALLKQYADLAYHSLRAAGSGFNLTRKEALDPDMGTLEVIPQDICRVFLNLATNACQALEEKWQKAEAGYEPELLITSVRLDDHAEFIIRDNGPGVPEAMRKRIFEPFVTTKDGTKGTGLGLSLTTDILRRHGGSIELDTEEGHYTEMRVLLPLEPPRRASETEEAGNG